MTAHPHIIIGLFGRFKGKEGHRWHCLPISDATRSGIRARAWISLFLPSSPGKGSEEDDGLSSLQAG